MHKSKTADLSDLDSGEKAASDIEDVSDDKGSVGNDEYIEEEEEEEDYNVPTDILRRSVSSFLFFHGARAYCPSGSNLGHACDSRQLSLPNVVFPLQARLT